MNDEKFELTISDLAGSGTYYADIADELRARDTAQREALAHAISGRADAQEELVRALSAHDEAKAELARVEAERDEAREFMCINAKSGIQYAEQRDVAKAQLEEAVGLLARLRYSKNYATLEGVMPDVGSFLARHTQAEQQEAHGSQCCEPTAEEKAALQAGDCAPEELWGGSRPTCPKCIAQGAQAGDDIAHMQSVMKGADDDLDCARRLHAAGYRRAALVTQPAGGEPVAEFFVEFDTLRRAMSIYGLAAPASNSELGALMEPYAVELIEAVADSPFPYPPAAAHGDSFRAWLAAEMPAGTVIGDPAWWAERILKRIGAAAHGELVAVVGTVPDGSGFKSLDFKVELESLTDGTRLYAAAHGDEAVRKDAERYRWLLENRDGMQWENMLRCCDLEGQEAISEFIDAAMRAQGDGEVQ